MLTVLYRHDAAVAIANRTAERAAMLARTLAHPVDGEPLIVPWSERTDLGGVDVVVNATSLGLRSEDPLEGAALRPEMMVIDLVPTAAATPLVRRARAAGCRVVDGLPMLLQQAVASFTVWTKRPAPVEAMRRALFASVS